MIDKILAVIDAEMKQIEIERSESTHQDQRSRLSAKLHAFTTAKDIVKRVGEERQAGYRKTEDGIELEFNDWEEIMHWSSLKARRGEHWGKTEHSHDLGPFGGPNNDTVAHKNCAECRELLKLAIKKVVK